MDVFNRISRGDVYYFELVVPEGHNMFDIAASIKKLGGYRPVELDAFKAKEINFAPEYVASMLEGVNGKKGEASGDVTASEHRRRHGRSGTPAMSCRC